MQVRQVGVEEELLLVDPRTRGPAALSGRAVAAHDAPVEVTHELFLQQIETSTSPCGTAGELTAGLRAGRRAVGEAAAAAGVRAVAAATHPFAQDSRDFTPQGRYQRIEAMVGETARQSMLCAMHVHVEVMDPDEGVGVVDRIRPWLPVLLAISANSPYWRGRDTGHASWRSQMVGRWPTAGPAEPFGGAEEYQRVAERMQAWGAAPDPGMLLFDVRLSHHVPTVEVRVADVCTEIDDALLIAMLVRALVSVAAEAGPAAGFWRSDLLRVATWRAARYGTGAELVHPVREELAPVRGIVEDLVAFARPALDEAGDTGLVTDLVASLLARGDGATRQRRVYERTGDLEAVVDDLAARTEASWLD